MIAKQITTIVIGVILFGLFLGFGVWRAAKSADRAIDDPRYRRRSIIRFAMAYIAVGVFIIVGVAAGKERVEALYGLPMGVIIIWYLLRSAFKIKVPPKQ
jgi:hypothetical protein